jgi:hypothetical protein
LMWEWDERRVGARGPKYVAVGSKHPGGLAARAGAPNHKPPLLPSRDTTNTYHDSKYIVLMAMFERVQLMDEPITSLAFDEMKVATRPTWLGRLERATW